MARPLRIQYPGALYHITNRGNERKSIFKDDIDRRESLKILSRSIETYGIVLHGFVLMKNHWHLLAHTPLGNLSEFMRHFNITYTSHYNRRHQRVGHLYQGRYKSFLVEADSYLSQVSRYIHLNPVRVANMKTVPASEQLHFLWNYKWSSLPGYINKSNRFNCVTYSTILEEYGGDTPKGRQLYKKKIVDDLTAGLIIKDQIVGQSILGSKVFVAWVRETFIKNKKDREKTNVQRIHRYLTM